MPRDQVQVEDLQGRQERGESRGQRDVHTARDGVADLDETDQDLDGERNHLRFAVCDGLRVRPGHLRQHDRVTGSPFDLVDGPVVWWRTGDMRLHLEAWEDAAYDRVQG